MQKKQIWYSIIFSHRQCTTNLGKQTTFWLCWREVKWIFAMSLGWKGRNISSLIAAL